MTAEIFLAVFLASMLVAAVQWVFVFTVYRPLQRWMANRAWDKMGKEGGVRVDPLFGGDRCIMPGGCDGQRITGSVFCRAHAPGASIIDDCAIVTETLARAPRIWMQRGHAHAGDRLQVFVEIPGLGWRIVFDEAWPLGAENLQCLWDGHTQKLKPTPDGPHPMLEEFLQDSRTNRNGIVCMRHGDSPGSTTIG